MRGRRRRRVVLVLTGALAVAVGLGAWAGVDAVKLRDELVAAAANLAQARQVATSGDLPTARAAVAEAQEHARAAAAAAENPVLAAGEWLPAVGDDVATVRLVARVVDDLAREALPGVLDAVDLLAGDSLFSDGGVDLELLAAAAPSVERASIEVESASVALAGVEHEQLTETVRAPVLQLTSALAGVSAQTRTAEKALRLLPSMLGADGPRTYVLVTQNNAEARSLGGLAGAFVEITADRGRLTLGDHLTPADIGAFDEPVLPLTEGEEDILGPLHTMLPGNVMTTPSFPRAAELITAMWEERRGVSVDGVLATDPVALGYLLAATGPVEVDGIVLTGEAAAMQLMHDVYLRVPDPEAQNAFFAAAAASVFDRLVGPDAAGAAALPALVRSAQEDRLLVWSGHEAEQAELSGTVLAGELRGARGASPVVGVYLNDATASKMSVFLDSAVTLLPTTCDSSDQTITARVELASRAPAGGAGLTESVTGVLYRDGLVLTNVLVYAPAGGQIVDIRRDGVSIPADERPALVHDGLGATYLETVLAPGESTLLEFDVTAAAELTGDPQLRITPGPRTGARVSASSICAGS